MKDMLKYRATGFSALCALIVLLMAPAPVSEAQTEQEERWENSMSHYPWRLPDAPQEDVDALKSRWKMIEEEMKTTSSEFAGIYSDYGVTHSSVLRWAPASGFVYINLYEMQDVLYFSYGKVSVTPSAIIFTVEREHGSRDFDNHLRTTPLRWIGAKWRRDYYLIPEDSLSDFGNYAAGFGAYNDFNGSCCDYAPFLVENTKADPPVKPVRPVVPKEYEFFLKPPIEATIRYVGRQRIVKDYETKGELYYHLQQKASLTSVRINAGKNQGVKRGLLFRLVTIPIEKGKYLKITRVGAEFSEGVVVREVDDEGKEIYYDYEAHQNMPHTPVVVGTKVTTSPL